MPNATQAFIPVSTINNNDNAPITAKTQALVNAVQQDEAAVTLMRDYTKDPLKLELKYDRR